LESAEDHVVTAAPIRATRAEPGTRPLPQAVSTARPAPSPRDTDTPADDVAWFPGAAPSISSANLEAIRRQLDPRQRDQPREGARFCRPRGDQSPRPL